jgi:monoamine oxidase
VEVLAAIAELTEMCNKVNMKEPHKTPNALEWDSMTMAMWLDDHVTSHRARAVLDAAVGGPVGGTAQNTSLLQYLYIAKANGGPLDLTSTEGALEFRIKGGSGLIVEGLAQRVGPGRIKLSTPVRSIEQGNGSVRVTTAGGSTYTAAAVVVAMAPAMAARIHYDMDGAILSGERAANEILSG